MMNNRMILVPLLVLVGACGSGVSAEPAPGPPAAAPAAAPVAPAKTEPVTPTEAPATEDPGKAVFVELGCNNCHSAAAGGLPASEGSFDLPGPGGTYEAAWLAKYLTKEEAIDGRKHPTKVGTEPAKRDALVAWLAALRKEK